jgi:hypothetical protein
MTSTTLQHLGTTSTTSTAAPVLAPHGEVESGTRLRRVASGATVIAAGVVTLAGFLTCPWENSGGQDAYLHSLLSNPPMAMLSMVLLHYGYLLFVPAVFVLARLARRRSPKLAGTALVLGVLGSGLSGLLVTDAYDLSLAQHLPLTQALAVENGISLPGMLAIALPSAFGTIFGLVLVLAAMWRARWISFVPMVLMLAGWVIGYGAHTLVRAGSGATLVAIALVLVGLRVLRMSDAEFATGERA